MKSKGRGITKSKKIEWNFGEKHKNYIRECRVNEINVAEGAVRAGKTIDNVFAFAKELEDTPDKIHLATGSTVANAKLNIGEANGFGLEYIFRGRSRWGKFKSNECLYVSTGTGQKIVIFAGGAKADSFKRLRGNSYGLWIATEINLHHEATITECFDRSLLAINRKIFWDLNPSPPKHKIYVDYIDKYKESQDEGNFPGGYNYQHFTIFDNINLTEERKAMIISEYTVGSIRYIRNILGQRVVSQGLIYEDFAENADDYFIHSSEVPRDLMISIGVDFGGGPSKHAFVATGITRDYSKLYVLMSESLETNLDPQQLSEAYVKFLRKVEKLFSRALYTYTDSAEQVLNKGFETQLRKEGLNRSVRNSQKGTILNRIKMTQTLIAQNRLYYTELAVSVKLALEEALWKDNDVEDERLDDGTTDIDTLDAFEYSFSSKIDRLSKYIDRSDNDNDNINQYNTKSRMRR